MFLLIDNYDSFTYNLVQHFLCLGRKPRVVKNDDPALLTLASDPALEMVCISPGPGNPRNAGLCLEFLSCLPHSIPVLGVCLGHQILGHFAGATVATGPEVMHGRQTAITHNESGIFHGLPNPLTVGRYHSLFVHDHALPASLEITARTPNGLVMGLRYTDRPWVGVQFHPESVLTPEGLRLLANFPSALLTDHLPGCSGILPHASPLRKRRSPVQMSAILDTVARGENLNEDAADEAFSRLMEGDLSSSQAGALLLALRLKGETPLEVGAAVNAVLAKAVPVPPYHKEAIDVVGTGGDAKGSFNCSTATSLTLAAMGYKALKHGNRSVSSRCGSADVLEKLGVNLDIAPENVGKQLDDTGFAFLFAPRFHPAFRHVMPLRRELGVRTLFNILGPLVNPARPTHHLIGAADKNQVSLIAETLARSNKKTIGAVIHGAGGYDELTTLGPADVVFVHDTNTRRATLDPADFGFTPSAEHDLSVTGPDDAAIALREVLCGRGPKAMRDMLALNVGLGIYLLNLDPATENTDPVCGYDKEQMALAMQQAKDAVAAGVGRGFVE